MPPQGVPGRGDLAVVGRLAAPDERVDEARHLVVVGADLDRDQALLFSLENVQPLGGVDESLRGLVGEKLERLRVSCATRSDPGGGPRGETHVVGVVLVNDSHAAIGRSDCDVRALLDELAGSLAEHGILGKVDGEDLDRGYSSAPTGHLRR